VDRSGVGPLVAGKVSFTVGTVTRDTIAVWSKAAAWPGRAVPQGTGTTRFIYFPLIHLCSHPTRQNISRAVQAALDHGPKASRHRLEVFLIALAQRPPSSNVSFPLRSFAAPVGTPLPEKIRVLVSPPSP
jgi:hypothetical protein